MAGFSDVLDTLISSSGQAFQSYQQAQTGFVPLQPGTYVSPGGQVVQTNSPFGVTTSSSTTLLLLAIVGAVFVFAFMALRK